MIGLIRVGCVCLFLGAFILQACNNAGDVGKPCNLTQEENRKNLKDLGEKARIVEASAACDLLSFCFANYFDLKVEEAGRTDFGYCSKECIPTQDDCPKGFTCDVFIKVQTLPDSHKDILAPLVGKTVCIKTPPQPEQ